MPNEISLQIPEGAEAGDTLTFSVAGTVLEVAVPPGSRAGDVLALQIASDDSNSNSNGNGNGNGNGNDGQHEHNIGGMDSDRSVELSTTTLRLDSGRTVTVPTAAASRTSESDTNEIDGDGNSDNEYSDGTYAMVWPSTIRLIEFVGKNFPQRLTAIMEKNDSPSVLELGSGLGYAGLVFAHMLAVFARDGKAHLTLTDVPRAVPRLQSSVESNRDLWAGKIQVRCGPLVWGSAPVRGRNGDTGLGLNTDSRFGWIVLSDVLYNRRTIPKLVQTLSTLITPPSPSESSFDGTRLVVAVRWRKPDFERAFFEDTAHLVDWELLDGECRLSWRDYGNPQCDASNRFFAQTHVGVQGKLTPLSDIDESVVGRMRDDEHGAWERMHIQIYLGTARAAS